MRNHQGSTARAGIGLRRSTTGFLFTRGSVAALVVMVVLASCAKQAPPPGGPVDDTAPELIGSEPPSGTTGFPLTASLRLLFSEKLDHRSFERGLFTNPRIQWAKVSWSGPEVRLMPVDSLLTDSTYVVTLGTGIQDRRSNRIGIPIVIGFSTGPEIDGSALVGEVVRAGKPAAGAGVWLYVWDEEKDIDPEVDVPYRQTETGQEGVFVLPFIRPVSRAYLLFAYLDANRTAAFEEGDPWGFFPEPLTVAALPETTGGVKIDLWDSGRTGSISGEVTGDWEPEGALWLEATAPEDSTAARAVRIGAPGLFRMTGVPPGKYLLSTFQDLNGNEEWDEEEDSLEPRIMVPDTLEVSVGEVVRGVQVRRTVGEEE